MNPLAFIALIVAGGGLILVLGLALYIADLKVRIEKLETQGRPDW